MKNKKTMIMGLSALAVMGMTVGCVCMYKKTKKPKLNIDSLSSCCN